MKRMWVLTNVNRDFLLSLVSVFLFCLCVYLSPSPPFTAASLSLSLCLSLLTHSFFPLSCLFLTEFILKKAPPEC